MYISYQIVDDDDVKDRIIKVQCDKCSQNTCHKVLASIKQEWCEIEDSVISVDGFDRYQIIHCEGCETISFRQQSCLTGSGNLEEKLYPEPFFEHHKQKNNLAFKDELGEIYYETISSFNAGNHILCAVGIRTIIEAVCNDQGVKRGYIRDLETDNFTLHANGDRIMSYNLKGKIFGLRDKEIITKNQNKMLHQLRFLGNDAAHKLQRVSNEELKAALIVIDNIMENIYVMPRHAENLPCKNKEVKN